MENNLKDKKIAILAHSCEGTTGWDDELANYCITNLAKEVSYFKFPFYRSKTGSIKGKTLTYGSQEQLYVSLIKFYKPEFLSFIKDFFYAIYWGLKYLRGYDYIFCMTNLITVAAIFLRKIGIIKKVYYTIVDYTPIKYSNKFINKIYDAIDQFACYHADVVFPLNKAMILGRANDNKIDITKVNRKEAPYGNHSENFTDSDYNKSDTNIIVYFGGVLKSKGAELFVPIMSTLLEKGYQNFKFLVMGGGDLDFLKTEVKKSGLEKYFEITGPIPSDDEVNTRLLGSGVALAPYYPEDINSFSYYADPGKVKVYMGCGLPIIITNVPPIAKDIQELGIGLITKYSAEDIAEKIIIITNNPGEFRKKSIVYGKKYARGSIFDVLFSSL